VNARRERTVEPRPPGSGGWLRRLLPYLLAHKAYVGVALGGALVSMAATAATPLVMRALVDGVKRSHPIAPWVTAMVGLGLVRFAMAYVRRYFGGRVALDIEYDLRNAIFGHVQRLDFAAHDQMQTGQVVSRANSDVRLIQALLAQLPLMSANLLLFVTSLVIMLRLDVTLTVVALLVLPAIAVVGNRMRSVVYPSTWDVQQQQAKVAGVVDEAVTGVRVVKGFGQEERELGRLTAAATDLYRSRIRNLRMMARYSAGMGVIPGVGQVAVFCLGGLLAVHRGLSLGTFLAFQTYLLQLIAPVRMTTMMLALAQQGKAGAERVLEVLDSVPHVTDRPGAVALPRLGGRLELRGVSFGYVRSEPVLRDIDLVVEPGETVAIVGTSGSGKSTIAALVPRFYDVQEGAVLVDGLDVRDVTLESLRGQIGVVFEDAFLFSDTVRANIAYGRPDATDDDVEAAARAAQAHEFVERLPAGYDTVVGERGLTLSGGQRQRLALARALLSDPQVLLLDDATSALDVRTEEDIHDSLRELMVGRSCLVIAHRRSSLALADRIVVLHHGRVADQGTHDELLARSPLYRALLAGPGEGVEGEDEQGVVAPVLRRPMGMPDRPAARADRDLWTAPPDDLPARLAARMAGRPGGGMGGGGMGGRGLGGFGPPTPELLERLAALPPPTDDPDLDLAWAAAPDSTFLLRRFVRPFWKPLAIGLVAIALQGVIDVTGPAIIRYGIDHAIVPAALGRGIASDAATRTILLVALVFLVVNLVDQGLSWFTTVYTGRLGSRLLLALRVRIFSQLQRLGLDYYDREMAGRVMTRMTSDVEAFNTLLQQGLITALVNAVTFVGVLAVMFAMNVELALLLLLVLVPLAVATMWFRGASDRSYEQVRERVAVVNSSFQEGISGVRITQSFAREGRNLDAFRSVASDHLDARLSAQRLQSTYFPFVDFLSVVAQALVLGVGVGLARKGSVTPGELIAFVLYVTTLFNPVQQLSQVFDSYQQARTAGKRIRDLFEMPLATPQAASPEAPGRLRGDVRFERVRFRYPGTDVDALRGLDLAIAPGETVALVGATGAGKSTIVKLLARFYDPDEGRVLVDGRDLRSLDLAGFRAQLGYVPQEPFLFSGDIAANIAYGRPGATPAEIEAAARQVGAHELIAALPFGYRTPVAERGRTLSSGQRQLLALARAHLVDPALLLLDEATANLDLATEARVQRALRVVAEGRTTVVIAHRLQTAARADRILVIEGGHVVEDGAHTDLLERGGRYADLWATSESPATVRALP
jgi:ATP-binding cassette subfamily B protein